MKKIRRVITEERAEIMMDAAERLNIMCNYDNNSNHFWIEMSFYPNSELEWENFRKEVKSILCTK